MIRCGLRVVSNLKPYQKSVIIPFDKVFINLEVSRTLESDIQYYIVNNNLQLVTVTHPELTKYYQSNINGLNSIRLIIKDSPMKPKESDKLIHDIGDFREDTTNTLIEIAKGICDSFYSNPFTSIRCSDKKSYFVADLARRMIITKQETLLLYEP
jgi:hypothetical protein